MARTKTLQGLLFQGVFCMVCAAAFSAGPSRVAAQNAPAIPAVGPGWDWNNPTNIAESRAFATLLFSSQDSGQPMAPFTFTNPPPALMDLMFLPQRVVFEHLYSHRLQQNPNLAGYEPLEELLAKEPLIRDAYRMFVTTGELRTSMVVDDSASYKHIMMILESFFESPENMVMWCDDWAAANGEVTSHCPTLSVPAPPEPEPYVQQPTPPELEQFEARLRYEVVNSRIPCMYKKGLYRLDGGQWFDPVTNEPTGPFDKSLPGFDCDDYARAMAAWLQWNMWCQS